MNRRHLFPFAPAQAPVRRDLFLMEAPIKSALEMIFKGFGQSNYFLDNPVNGFATVMLREQSFERVMGVVCQLIPQLLEWKREEGIVSVRAAAARPEPSEDAMAIFQRARFPVVDGIPCRVAGVLLGGATPVAILETGDPRSSEVQIVEQGQKIKALGGRYLVERVYEDGLILKNTEKTLKIPLAFLAPKVPPTKR